MSPPAITLQLFAGHSRPYNDFGRSRASVLSPKAIERSSRAAASWAAYAERSASSLSRYGQNDPYSSHRSQRRQDENDRGLRCDSPPPTSVNERPDVEPRAASEGSSSLVRPTTIDIIIVHRSKALVSAQRLLPLRRAMAQPSVACCGELGRESRHGKIITSLLELVRDPSRLVALASRAGTC